jgi:hypothetical protein
MGISVHDRHVDLHANSILAPYSDTHPKSWTTRSFQLRKLCCPNSPQRPLASK